MKMSMDLMRWLLVLIALALTVGAAGFLFWVNTQMVKRQQDLLAAQQRLAEARESEALAIERAKRAQEALKLMRNAKSAGLDAESWASRRFNMSQARLSRQAANELLSEMFGAPDRLFGAEEFELSVTKRSEGLFGHVTQPDSEVQVSVRGVLLFRSGS